MRRWIVINITHAQEDKSEIGNTVGNTIEATIQGAHKTTHYQGITPSQPRNASQCLSRGRPATSRSNDLKRVTTNWM